MHAVLRHSALLHARHAFPLISRCRSKKVFSSASLPRASSSLACAQKGRMTGRGLFFWPKRSTSRLRLVDDSRWGEVEIINYYAVFMGNLSMALKGLSFLVITWTTVVLLGGFVSMLEKNDFWSLTVITLVQTAGIFDFVMHEKLSNMWIAFKGLCISMMVTSLKEPPAGIVIVPPDVMLCMLSCGLLAFAKLAVQALVFVILLCPLGVFFVFGLPTSAGISIWRLIKHHYRNTDDAANMKPALHVLYSLAVVQGALFFYRASYASAAKGHVKLVSKWYKFNDREDLVWDYLRDIRIGCEKDPSFARGRNLITYAVNQMESMSPDNYVSGVRILGTVIKEQKNWIPPTGQHVLIQHLLMGSASSAHLLHNLLWTLDQRSPYDMETMESAARIVEHIAGGIRLKQFPGGIKCIASLLDTQGLELQGLRILRELAADSEENCRVIGNTQGLLSRIMAPVTLDLLHNGDHHLWDDNIVDEPLKVMKRLMTAPGETGKKLRRQIGSNKEVVSSSENILKCSHCHSFRQQLAMGILAQVYIDTSVTSMDTECRKDYINTLLCIFFASGRDSQIRELAGEKLATIASISRSNAMVIFCANDEVLDNLISILLQGDKSTYRVSAAKILEQLCIRYIENIEHLSKLKKFKTDVLPKVLREILCCWHIEEHKRAGAENGSRFATQGTDIEGQGGRVPQKDGRDTAMVHKQECEERNDKKLLTALLSLSISIFDKLICTDQDFALLVDAAALGDGQVSLARKLMEMVERNTEHTMVCLKILKLIGEMVISMMKHASFFIMMDNLQGLVDSLSSASENMKALEASMIFVRGDDNGARTKKPFRTLASLVKEAQDLVDKNYAQGLGAAT